MKTQCLNEAESELSALDDLANEILQELDSHLFIPRLTSRDHRYDYPVRIGGTITVNRVFRAVSYNGRTIPRQPKIDGRIEMKVNIGSGAGVDSHQKTPAECGRELASLYDIAGGREFHNGTHYQAGVAGGDLTVGEILGIKTYTSERRMPYSMSALFPSEDLAAIASDIEQHGAPPVAGEVVREHYRGRYFGFSLYETNDLPYYEIADYGASTPLVNDANGYRGSRLPTDGWQPSTKVLNNGQLITIAGVHDVKPHDDYRPLAELKTFLVTDDVNSDASGQAMIPISPAINASEPTSNPGADVYRTCSNEAADNAAIIVVGAGTAGENRGKRFRQGFIFGERAMQYVHVRMEKSTLGDIEQGYATDPQTGLGVRRSAKNNRERVDVCGAVKIAHPELVVRVITGAV